MNSAPLNKIPLFIKAGAVIPMGSSIEYIDDAVKTDTTVHIYTGSSSFCKLYDDDGRSYSYESGNYIETMIECKEVILTIEWGSEREYGFNIRLVDENRKTVRDILVKP